MMNNKINWFDADRALSLRVAEFMRTQVWKKEINLKYSAEIDSAKQSLENLDKLEGSILAEKIPEMRTLYLARIAELEAERDDQLELEAKFEKTPEDKDFMRKIRKDSTCAADEIVRWFEAYHLEVNQGLVDEILTASGEKLDWKTVVATSGKVVTAFNPTNCLRMLYCKAYEHMVNAGTIKAQQIPSLVREKYSRKPKNNKNKGKK